LPSLGDFASRRLDASFIEPWDGWLAAGLLALREANPRGWLEAYLGSPSWRFLLMPEVMPGAAGPLAWAGVLMPSVDRVGRYFPLTLALPLGAGPATAQQMTGLWHWLGRLDELARDALHEDWGADRLELELGHMAAPDLAPQAMVADGPSMREGELRELHAEPELDAALHIGVQAQRLWAQATRGQAWWFARPDESPPRLLLSKGLPCATALPHLFGPAATI
jgi:type VI secretion system protein ImpM